MPQGAPMRLPPQVTGALSRLQGQLMAAQPAIQNAYAWHWLAARQAAPIPAFQELTQHMLWGLYGATALNGLLRFALSGRGTPVVMESIIDQINLINAAYDRTANILETLLQDQDVRELPPIRPWVQSLQALDQVRQNVQQPMQMVLTGLPWSFGAPMQLYPLREADLTWAESAHFPRTPEMQQPPMEREMQQQPEMGGDLSMETDGQSSAAEEPGTDETSGEAPA